MYKELCLFLRYIRAKLALILSCYGYNNWFSLRERDASRLYHERLTFDTNRLTTANTSYYFIPELYPHVPLQWDSHSGVHQNHYVSVFTRQVDMIVTLPFLLNFYRFRSNLYRNNLFVKTINLGQIVREPINAKPSR